VKKYILADDGVPEEIEDLEAWGRWFEIERIKFCKVTHIGCYEVSTVFLGLDHSFSSEGPPLLWETMVFLAEGDPGITPVNYHDLDMTRCPGTIKEANEMHLEMVNKVQHVVDNPDLYPVSCGNERIRETDRDDIPAVQPDGPGNANDDAGTEQGHLPEPPANGDSHEEGPV